jgi:hypothetical protein
MAKYIYSIIQAKAPLRFEILGLNSAAVYPVKYRDLSAVVSDSSVTNFDNLSKEELMACVAFHQKVNEELLKGHDVVPMAFGMVARSDAEIIDILGRAYIQFKRGFKKIENKAEFAVQTFWDEKEALNDLVSNNSEIKRLRREIASSGKIRGMAAKMKLGKLIVETLKACKDHYSKDIEEKVKGCSYDIKRMKLADENMVSNLSLLVDKFREGELDARMQSLGAEYKDKLRFKYIGPMAPGSFVNINLSLGNFELVESARQTLGVPEEASFYDIKGMYLGLAKKYHPDRHEYTNDPKILEKMTQKMKEVQEAYEALESYCRLCLGPTSPDTYSFRKQDVEKTLIIKENG